MSEEITGSGGCYCGDIRYRVSGQAFMKAQCHCRPCQYITGGGPNYFALVSETAFEYTQGSPASFERSDIEAPRLREFCGRCGTHLTTRIRERALVVIKVGTLDQPEDVFGRPAMAIHCKEIPGFHVVPQGMPAFEELPPRAGS